MIHKSRITKEDLDRIFGESTDQGQVIIELFKLVIPGWVDVNSVGHYPECSEELSKGIFNRFFAFDAKHHPRVMRGGIWMNSGFSVNEDITDPEEVWVNLDKIKYKEEDGGNEV